MSGARPLQLILARNLLSSLSTPAFLVDADGNLLFFNEAAGALLGRRYEETGQMTAPEWTATFGPFDEDGRPIPYDEVPLTHALRGNRPSHGGFMIRSAGGAEHAIEASALPLVGDQNFHGAIVIFWPAGEAVGPS
ncbi:MAG TPA: PAS domain-containing protein [Solirubrobacteraceae bacterium]|nr:PAS domain-containing protein [Solirubrobacteraceae bacterium]